MVVNSTLPVAPATGAPADCGIEKLPPRFAVVELSGTPCNTKCPVGRGVPPSHQQRHSDTVYSTLHQLERCAGIQGVAWIMTPSAPLDVGSTLTTAVSPVPMLKFRTSRDTTGLVFKNLGLKLRRSFVIARQ